MFAKIFATALSSALLAGCTTTVVKVQCPPLVQYDQAFMTALDEQLASVGPAVGRAIVDYRQLRDTVRACAAAQ